MICGCSIAFGEAKQVHDIVRGTDGPGGVGGLSGLIHPLIVLVANLCLTDGDGAVVEVHTFPSEAGDLRGAKAEPEGQQDWYFHFGAPDSGHKDGNLLRFQILLLNNLLLGQGNIELKRGVVFPQRGGKEAVDVPDVLWGRGVDIPPVVLVWLGLGIDGLLNHGVGESVEPERHKALKAVAADHVIAPDGGRGEDTILAADIFVNGLLQGHGGGIPADLLVVKLVSKRLQLGFLFGWGGEGEILPFATGIFAHIELDTPGAGGELFCGCHKIFSFRLRPRSLCDTIRAQ